MNCTVNRKADFQSKPPGYVSMANCTGSAIVLLFYAAAVNGQTDVNDNRTIADFEVEEIVVTARKREESVQDIPLAIVVHDAESLRQRNITQLEDLAQWTPGLSFQDVNGAFQNPVIRGLSQIDQTSIQGNVTVFLNGVPLNNRSGLEFGLLDLERIEVVKGPQSALYGRNAFAGAINYVTRKAVIGERDASVDVTLGTRDRYEGRGSVNLAISDQLALRAFGGYSEFDGTIENVRDGDYLGGYEKFALGATLLYQPTETWSIEVFAAKNRVENDAVALRVLDPNLANCGSSVVFGGTTFNTLFCGPLPQIESVDISPKAEGNTGDSITYSATLDYAMSFANLRAQVSYIEGEYSILLDTTGNPAAIDTPSFLPGLSTQVFITATTPLGEATNYEIRLDNSDGGLDWTVGANYFDSRDQDVVDVFFQPLSQPDASPAFFSGRGRDLDTEAWDVFGALSYEVTERAKLSAELRYTSEDQSMVGLGNSAGVSGTQDFSFLTPRLTLEYRLSDTSLLYANAARGVKTGGFNANAAGRPEFTYDIEENVTYELGVKGSLFDNRLVGNVSVFYVDWQDIQQQRAIAGTNVSVVTNSGDATSTGIEIDATAYLHERLSVRAAIAISNPELDEGFFDGESAAACGAFIGTLITDPGCSPTDAGGRQIPRTSEVQFAVSGNYVLPNIYRDYNGFFRLDYSHESGKFSTGLNFDDQGDIDLVNVRAGMANDRFEISLWVDNVFDSEWNRRATTVPFSALGAPTSGIVQYRVNPGELRTAGIDFRAKF